MNKHRPSLLTRGQVAARLRKHVSTIRRLEQRGELSPTTRAGVHFFDPSEVEAYAALHQIPAPEDPTADPNEEIEAQAAKVPGPVVAQIFRLLIAGKSLAEIVLETEINPLLVEFFARRDRAAVHKMRRGEREEERERTRESFEEWDRELRELEPGERPPPRESMTDLRADVPRVRRTGTGGDGA